MTTEGRDDAPPILQKSASYTMGESSMPSHLVARAMSASSYHSYQPSSSSVLGQYGYMMEKRSQLQQLFLRNSPKEEQCKLAKEIVDIYCPLNFKYSAIDFMALLQNNCDVADLSSVLTAFKRLLCYATNLLLPVSPRPGGFYQIKWKNPFFQKYIQPVVGGVSILQLLGYSETLFDDTGQAVCLQFPSGTTKVDVKGVSEVACDLLIGLTELNSILDGTHSHLQKLNAAQSIPKPYYDLFCSKLRCDGQPQLECQVNEIDSTVVAGNENDGNSEITSGTPADLYHSISTELPVPRKRHLCSSKVDNLVLCCENCLSSNQQANETQDSFSSACSELSDPPSFYINEASIAPHNDEECDEEEEEVLDISEHEERDPQSIASSDIVTECRQVSLLEETIAPDSSINVAVETDAEEAPESEMERPIERTEEVEVLQNIPDEKVGPISSYVYDLMDALQSDYPADIINLAFNVIQPDSTMKPTQWLQESFPKLLEEVSSAIAASDDYGTFVTREFILAILAANGDCDRAVELCTKKRDFAINLLIEEGFSCKEEVVKAISAAEGDIDVARRQLHKTYLSRFTTRFDKSAAESDLLTLLNFKSESGAETNLRIQFLKLAFPLTDSSARLASHLIDVQKFNVEDCIDAAQQCSCFDFALNYLDCECCMCYGRSSMKKLATYPGCQCRICFHCFASHVQTTVQERHVTNLSCPNCEQPNLDEEPVADDYFSNLGTMIQSLCHMSLLDEKFYKLFHNKLLEFQLRKDPNFCWCAHCPEGFLWEGSDMPSEMTCARCGEGTCCCCKEKWLEQHQGITCEAFKEWLHGNNAETQQQGLRLHLDKHGIGCPNCDCQFDLARGGCMHFKCYQCRFEFCCGCRREFKKGSQCQVHPSCADKGLHAHHPRDCLFYLRDFEIRQLQELLYRHEIKFDTTLPPDVARSVCPIMEQHMTDQQTFVDEECGLDVAENCAGFCTKHYMEYLTSIVNIHRIDPVVILDTPSLLTIIQREHLIIPSQGHEESQDDYHCRLRRFIQNNLPLVNVDWSPNNARHSSASHDFVYI